MNAEPAAFATFRPTLRVAVGGARVLRVGLRVADRQAEPGRDGQLAVVGDAAGSESGTAVGPPGSSSGRSSCCRSPAAGDELDARLVVTDVPVVVDEPLAAPARGSVHRSPASFLTVPYLAPAVAVKLVDRIGAMLTVIAAFAAAEAVAAPAVPVKLSWQMTATPIAGTSSSRHFRPPAGGDPRRNRVDDPRPAQGMRMCDPSRSRVPPVPVRPQARRSRRCDRPAIRDAFRRNLTITTNGRQSSAKPLSIP